MPVIEFEAKTTEEAIESACSQLHIAPDELKFEILSTGSSGIFGLGGKKAKIRVIIEEKITAPKPEPKAAPAPAREKPVPAAPESLGKNDRDFSPRSRNADGRKREPRRSEGRPEREKKRPEARRQEPREKPARSAAPAAEKPVKETARIKVDRDNLPLPTTVAGAGESMHEGPADEVMTMARDSLIGLLKHMDVESNVVVTRIKDRIILTIDGENSGLLIGKKGSTLDALQFLVNKIVNKSRDEKVRVVVDTEQYRERRHQSLIDLAEKMAEKAKRNRRPVTISQLSAHDRRVVHLALQDVPGLRTRSRGDGPLKNIVIIPGSKRSAGKAEKSADIEEPDDLVEENLDNLDDENDD